MPIALTSLLLHVGADTRDAEDGLTRVHNHMGNLGGSALDLGLKLGGTIFAVKSLAQGAVGLGTALLSPNAALEQNKIAFKGLLGSAQAADSFLREMQQFAASTPFEFPELVTASQHMLAFGFQAKQIKPLLTSIGDAISAMGGSASDVDAVVRVFGQMHAATKVTTQDMYQLTNFGIPAFDMLAKGMGKTVPELQKMISQGLVPADKAIGILQQSFDKSFGGSMAQQSRSFNGLMSTLADNARLALMSFTGPLFERAKTSLDDLGQIVSSPAFQEFATTMGERVGQALDFTGKQLSALGTVVSGLAKHFEPLVQIVSRMGETFKPLTGYLIPNLVASLPKINDPLQTFTRILDDLVSGALDQFTTIWMSLGPALSESMPAIIGIGESFAQLVQSLAPLLGLLNPIYKLFLDLLPVLAPLIPMLFQFGSQVMSAIARNVAIVAPAIVNLVKVLETGLAPIIKTVIDVASQLLPVIGDLLATAFDTIGPIIAMVANLLAEKLGPILKQLAPIIQPVIEKVGQWITQLATDLMPLIQAVGQLLMKILPPAFDFIGGALQILLNVFKAVWPTIEAIVSTAMGIISNIIHIVTDLIKGNWKGVWEDIKKLFGDAWEGIKRIGAAAINSVWETIKALAQPILDAVLKPFQMARDTIGAIWKGLGNFMVDAVNNFVIKSINDFIGKVASAVDWVTDHLHAGKPLSAAEHGLLANLPHFAEGGMQQRTGWAVVGEKGPELAWLTAGSHVWSNAHSSGILPPAPNGNTGAGGDNGIFGGFNPIEAAQNLLGNIDDWFVKGASWLRDRAFQAFGVPSKIDIPPFGDIGGVFANAVKSFFDGDLLGGDISGALHSAGAHWWLAHISQGFHDPRNPAHGGIDFGIGFHTPLAALLGGVVYRAGYYPWGGELDLWANLPGHGRGLENYTHLDLINPAFMKAGTFVPSGAVIGLSGGENPGWPGGLHPAQRRFSSGPHLHYNWFVNRPWANDDLNPTPFINSLRGGSNIRKGFASGGWVTEPVVGYGLHSGGVYSFAEHGPEYINRSGQGGGDTYIINANTIDEHRAGALGALVANEILWKQRVRGRS